MQMNTTMRAREKISEEGNDMIIKSMMCVWKTTGEHAMRKASHEQPLNALPIKHFHSRSLCQCRSRHLLDGKDVPMTC
jgi:hypothetical protein